MEPTKNCFSEKYYDFLEKLKITGPLPDETELLYPYDDPGVRQGVRSFFDRFYRDEAPRTFLIGINPGRFGGGVTGIAFTDPIHLADSCGIPNSFARTHELSSRFIYEMIAFMGGPEAFYRRFFLTALSPLGFTHKGKNRNYYDTPALWESLKPWIVATLRQQLDLGADRRRAFSLGQGKNYKILCELNREHGFFEEIRPLPHPRWVMQYRLKRKEEFLRLYKEELTGEGGEL